MKRRSSKSRFSLFDFLIKPFLWVIGFVWEKIAAVLFAAVVLLAFFGIREVLYADPYFQVASVKIYPNGILTSSQYQQVEKECTGQNLLKLDFKHLIIVAKANPYVKDVKIRRKLPGELEILLGVRKAAAELQLVPKGEFYTVDEEGVVVSTSKNSQIDTLILTHYDYKKKRLDLFERYNEEGIHRALGLFQAFKQHEIMKNEKVEHIAIDHLGNLTVYLVNGPAIRTCGNATFELQKLNAMHHLFQGEERNRIGSVDACGKDVVVQYR
ncbi:MAG: hypothetical protein HY582_04175 [Candidatus Omnitrophica bacterium]|nr:hypothetical protein [Candidatus Omnitrophota bacterium]